MFCEHFWVRFVACILSSLGHAGPLIASMDVRAQLSETAQTLIRQHGTFYVAS
jgi:hypothetical protein